MKFLNLEGLTNYTTKLLDKMAIMLAEKADKNHVHDKSEQMYSYTIDLSDNTYDQDTYYPVVGYPLPTNGFIRIKLAVHLNSGTVPTWSTHGSGFTCSLDLLATSLGWGRTNGNTIILDHSYLWATSNPCGYSQLHNSSRPVLWLRGGGKYFVWSEYEANFDIKTSEYTEYENTVTPTTTYPGIVLNKATITADLNGNASSANNSDTLDGYHGDNYAFIYSNYGANYFNSMDLNDWTRPGEYAIQSGCTNTPTERGEDTWGTIFVVKGLTDRISQYAVFWNESGNPLWHRCLNGSTWSTWLKVRDGGNAATANNATYSNYMAGWSDNRSVNTAPNDYNARFEVKGLKTNSAIGSPDNSAFSTVMGLRAWHDSTGGNSHELAFTGNGQVFQRHGSTDSWGSWNRFYTSDNITCGTSGLTSGSSTLASGNIYLQYE